MSIAVPHSEEDYADQTVTNAELSWLCAGNPMDSTSGNPSSSTSPKPANAEPVKEYLMYDTAVLLLVEFPPPQKKKKNDRKNRHAKGIIGRCILHL